MLARWFVCLRVWIRERERERDPKMKRELRVKLQLELLIGAYPLFLSLSHTHTYSPLLWSEDACHMMEDKSVQGTIKPSSTKKNHLFLLQFFPQHFKNSFPLLPFPVHVQMQFLKAIFVQIIFFFTNEFVWQSNFKAPSVNHFYSTAKSFLISKKWTINIEVFAP